jgi:hypothetical protein
MRYTASGFVVTSSGCQGIAPAAIVDPGATVRARSLHDHRRVALARVRCTAMPRVDGRCCPPRSR